MNKADSPSPAEKPQAHAVQGTRDSRDSQDDMLILGMLHSDRGIADFARRVWNERHAADQPIKEPPHCDQCFEGCPKCQPA